MPKSRKPLYVGEQLPEKRGRGRPGDTAKAIASQGQAAMIANEAIRKRLLGRGYADAMAATAEEFGCSRKTVEDLYDVNVSGLIVEIAQELILLQKLTSEEARGRMDNILGRKSR